MKKRFVEIDLLRGIAMLAMILIHTCYYFLNDRTALFLWKWNQFAVQVFIFCSAYLFFQKPQTLSISYVKKRLIRLIKPYYIFLLFFIPIFFAINPQTPKLKYILQSIFLIGGVDINWLVLLFVILTIIFPLLWNSYKKYKPLFVLYSIIAIGSSLLFIFYKFPLSYKYIFWLPWSVIPIFTLYFVQNKGKRKFKVILVFLSELAFLISYHLEKTVKHNLGMYENKYPPTIYFLAYGTLMTLTLYLLTKLIRKSKIITNFISYLSLYSYSIYFIHYTILIVFASQIKLFPHWSLFFATVLLLSLITQLGINKLRNPIKSI